MKDALAMSMTSLPDQYASIAFTERLAEAGIDPSVGSVGDAYDNALAESVIGLFKTEVIKPRAPWRTVEQVEMPPWSTSTGSTTAACSRPAATSRPSNLKLWGARSRAWVADQQ